MGNADRGTRDKEQNFSVITEDGRKAKTASLSVARVGNRVANRSEVTSFPSRTTSRERRQQLRQDLTATAAGRSSCARPQPSLRL